MKSIRVSKGKPGKYMREKIIGDGDRMRGSRKWEDVYVEHKLPTQSKWANGLVRCCEVEGRGEGR